MGNPQKCSGECFRSAFWRFPESAQESAPESAREIGSASGSAPRSAFPHSFPKERRSWDNSLGSSQFSRHSRVHSPGHFLGIPKRHPESTRRSTFGDSPRSTPVNGRRDRNGNLPVKKYRINCCNCWGTLIRLFIAGFVHGISVRVSWDRSTARCFR